MNQSFGPLVIPPEEVAGVLLGCLLRCTRDLSVKLIQSSYFIRCYDVVHVIYSWVESTQEEVTLIKKL